MLFGLRAFGQSPFGGPGLTHIHGSAACLSGVVTRPPSPLPPGATLSGIVTARVTGPAACLTAVSQDTRTLAIRIINAANQPTALGNFISHEEIVF